MIRNYSERIKLKLTAICIAILLITSTGNVYANEYEVTSVNKNEQSVYNFMRFNDMFTTVQLKRTEQNSIVEYPEEYAGAYIDQNDILHINYIEDSSNLIKDIIVDNNISYDPVEFSYSMLEEIYNLLSSNMNELLINSVYIDEINNNINISANKNQQGIINQYLEDNIPDFSTDSIVFSEEIEAKYTESGGSTLNSSLGIFTLGYNAYQSSTQKYGFVTCGHAVTVGSEVKNSSGTVLGKTSDRTLGGKLDAAFVPYNSQSKKTSASLTGPDISGTFTSSQIVTGMNVTKYGYTTNLTSGKVTSTSATVTVGSNTHSDQVMMSINQRGGDSGGPVVFNFTGPLQPGQKRPSTLVGIATIAQGDTVAFASKAANINSSFGLNTYTN